MKRTNTASSPSTNVGTPNTAYSSTISVCSAASVFERLGRVRDGADGIGVEAGPRDRVAEHVFVVELAAVHVARREQLEVRVEELVGEVVARGDAVAAARARPCPTPTGRAPTSGGSSSATCTWSRENGT